jgi:hypothetical protein
MTVAAADFNGDGSIDLAGFDNNEVLTILTNNGNGSFSVCSTNRYFFSIQSITAADVNHDGKPDIIVSDFQSQSMSILTNDGSGGFDLAATLATGQGPTSVAAADLNGDGRIDLISANEYEYTLSVYLNQVSLNILRSGANAFVTWSSSATNWTLQQSTNLTAANWTAFATANVGNNGILKTATNQPAGGINSSAWSIREPVCVIEKLFEQDDGLPGLIKR